jgi:arsenate reductase
LSLIIYHNPACGSSRNTLAMIRQSGVEPHVIEYLKTRRPGRGWSN